MTESILPDVPGQKEFLESWLTGSQRKTAYALRRNCEAMIAGHDRRKLVEIDAGDGKTARHWQIDGASENLNCTAFLTLTVGDVLPDGKFQQVWDAKEASRRINNLNRRLLPDLFSRAIVVTERHASGAIHFHVLGILRCRSDVRTGFNFEAVARRDYRSASEELRGLWQMLREKLPEYGFGRAELTPIKKTGEAVACYISKYIEKNVCNRRPEDARKKLVRYIGWEKSQLKPNEFSWGTVSACTWRANARGAASLIGVTEKEEWAEKIGPRWGYFVTQRFNALGKSFWRLDFGERELLRAEIVREIGEHSARRLDGRKLFLAEEKADLDAAYLNGTWKPCWNPPVAVVPEKFPAINLPCLRPHWKNLFKIPGAVRENPKPGAQMIFVATNRPEFAKN